MLVRAVLCVSCLLVLGTAGLEGRVPVPRDSGEVSALPLSVQLERPASDRRLIPLPPRVQAVVQQAPGDGRGVGGRPARPWWGWLLLGRLHPIVVHFPIGLLTAAAIIEVLHVVRRRPLPSEPGTYCLVIGIVGGLVSVWLGTLNAAHQSMTGDAALALERHRMMGWTALVAAVAALGAGQIARRRTQIRTMAVYLGLVVATSAVVGATGHLGGGLVFGEDYLTDVLPWNEAARRESRTAAASPASRPATAASLATAPSALRPKVASPAAEAPAPAAARPTPAPSHAPLPGAAPAVAAAPDADADMAAQDAANIDFARDVMPILEKTCVECHGPDKVKARLRMDSIAGLQKGGKNGPLFKPGDAENSLIMRRVQGLDGEDQMPLDKDPLTEAQIDTLRRWIAAGASFGAAGSQ
jgi:uncharacterized membrane protein/mono/diheme cytochrome c family protein